MTGCCPAEVIVTVQISQKVYVEYYSTHIGHEVSVEHFRLSYECRRDLAGNFDDPHSLFLLSTVVKYIGRNSLIKTFSRQAE